MEIITPNLKQGKVLLNSLRNNSSSNLNRHQSPRNYWQNKENQFAFLEKLKNKYKIKTPKDWINVRKQDLLSNGGATILRKYGSLFNALKEIYSDIEWKREWFTTNHPHGYWNNKQNQRNFFENLAVHLRIQKPYQWGSVTKRDIVNAGGNRLLNRYGSIRKALQSVFPKISWQKEWFLNIQNYPRNYWKNKVNQRKFLDGVASSLGIKEPEDWGKVKYREIVQHGGSGLLSYYNRSLFKTLQNVYTDIRWRRDWFPFIPKYSASYWNDMSNQIYFLDSIAKKYNIEKISDWQRVTVSLIKKNGGRALLSKYGNSIVQVLSHIYPGKPWRTLSPQLFDNRSELQEIMWNLLQAFFPSCKMESNYRHPALPSEKSPLAVELDVWIPEYNLAFEYHGQQHYRDVFNTLMPDQRNRDDHRRELCEKNGITLIEIPYWWDGQENSLLATILQVRPDLKKQIISSTIAKTLQ